MHGAAHARAGKAEFYCFDTEQQVDAFWDFVRVLSKLPT
jgi:hypothetical protein